MAIGFMGLSGFQQQPETMPLVPMMRLLLSDMQKVDAGIYTEDFEMIAENAGNIADHPTMTEEDKKLVKATLGEKIKQFVVFDMTVHHHADSMRIAAEKENMKEVLRHYNIVQQGCVDCHANFREPITQARK
ncbi:MAG: hypothetical protein U5J95_11385 [Balneolaceae bacterium]|nr:hypothetical protein [Balneolaceae bacterium]